jgi:hypothetical protein
VGVVSQARVLEVVDRDALDGGSMRHRWVTKRLADWKPARSSKPRDPGNGASPTLSSSRGPCPSLQTGSVRSERLVVWATRSPVRDCGLGAVGLGAVGVEPVRAGVLRAGTMRVGTMRVGTVG